VRVVAILCKVAQVSANIHSRHTDDGVEGRRLVQVHSFPALRVRRTEDWGWVLGTRLSLSLFSREEGG
jgi:hypothetical protein